MEIGGLGKLGVRREEYVTDPPCRAGNESLRLLETLSIRSMKVLYCTVPFHIRWIASDGVLATNRAGDWFCLAQMGFQFARATLL